nr:MAG TPA: hypothetical protein [Caudoviricetes sp.]
MLTGEPVNIRLSGKSPASCWLCSKMGRKSNNSSMGIKRCRKQTLSSGKYRP